MAYLRKPSEHYLSGLQQKIKWSTVVRMRPRPKEYRKVLESYDACFGPSAVSARLFHRDHLENGDIVADFCKHYLAEFRIDPAKLGVVGRVNETLSAEYPWTFSSATGGVARGEQRRLHPGHERSCA